MICVLPVLCLVACSDPAPVEVEPEPCTTYVVTEMGDTVPFVDLAVPPANLSGVREWWTEGDCR